MATDMRCPACGGISTDAEFCSECGALMAGTSAPAPSAAPAPVPPVPGAPDLCPVCGEARPGPFARYCDNCRYDFLEKKPFGAAPAAAQPPAAPVPAAAPPVDQAAQSPPAAPVPAPAAAPMGAQRWDLHASVDPSLRRPEDPMPTDLRPRIYPLDLSDHLIGRRSDKEDIHPEVAVTDPGISRRHARILRAADGALSLLDLGSMNGTRLNGAPVEPNVAAPLRDGDEVTLGCWTRLAVRAR